MYTVADVMTRSLVTLKEGDDLGLADSIVRLARVRHLPVVRGEALVGLVTHRDLIRVLAERGVPGRAALAGEVMTRDVLTMTSDTPLRKALGVMLRHKYGCIPVVDDGKLVGIVTEADLVKFALRVVKDLDRFSQTAVLEALG